MEKQISFSDVDCQNKKIKTRKEIFLEKMSLLVPIEMFCSIIQPYYYKNGNGRQPVQLVVILKMYLVSCWYNLSDVSCEEMLYENLVVKNYVGVTNDVPDATTLGKFRVEIIEKNKLNKKIFDELNKRFVENGVMFREGTIVDATIIDAPDSKKNKNKNSNPEMASTWKNNKARFGMKAHIGVDEKSGLVHSVTATAANVADITVASQVLHGEEQTVRGDAGYIGIEKRDEICQKFHDGTGEVEQITRYPDGKHARKFKVLKKRAVKFVINRGRGNMKSKEESQADRMISKIRSKVEHAFLYLKHLFGFRKTRYRTIAKNENKLFMLFALANIYKISAK